MFNAKIGMPIGLISRWLHEVVALGLQHAAHDIAADAVNDDRPKLVAR
jgi:hypothetical protein